VSGSGRQRVTSGAENEIPCFCICKTDFCGMVLKENHLRGAIMATYKGRINKICGMGDYGFIEIGSVKVISTDAAPNLRFHRDLLFHVRENRDLGPQAIPRYLRGRWVAFEIDFNSLSRVNQPRVCEAELI
jgi:hypothetical protein